MPAIPMILMCKCWADEPIAASRQGLDPALAAWLLAEHPTQRGDLDREVALLDGDTVPRGVHQPILGDRDARPLHEHAQQGDCALAQRDGLGAAEQDLSPRVESAPRKF